MKIIDLSHSLADDITTFNEEEKPEIRNFHSHERDGFAQKKLTFFSHNSTHIDAPFHILQEGMTLDQYPLESFYGKAVCADCRNSGAIISRKDLEKYADQLIYAHFILIYTGWYEKWGTDSYKTGYPVLDKAAAEWLSDFKLKGIGLDTISLDPVESTELINHKIILAHNLIVIENLTGLAELPVSGFHFSCLPLKILNADGSPVRAVAII